MNFAPPQWSCASRNPCMWSSHPGVSVFISNIYELDYPYVIHTLSVRYPHLSTHYPHIIHLQSVLYEAVARAHSTLPAHTYRLRTRLTPPAAQLGWPWRRLPHLWAMAGLAAVAGHTARHPTRTVTRSWMHIGLFCPFSYQNKIYGR